MLVLKKNCDFAVNIDGKYYPFTEIYTASDIKKIAKNENISFLDVAETMILIGIDDNGNNYYVQDE